MGGLMGQQAQNRLVSGVLLSPQGEPLPGVNIIIKGTTRGTVTNMEGWYSIEAPLGAVLVYSFIGFTFYEVTVTERNSAAAGSAADNTRSGPLSGTAGRKAQNPSANYASARPKRRKGNSKTLQDLNAPHAERGVAVLSDSSAAYEVKGQHPAYQDQMTGPLAKIKFNRKNKKWVLVPSYYARQQMPRLRLEFTTALSSSFVNRLPRLQDQYAQGSASDGALVAGGPENGELFSWGPPIAALAYDADGRLVPQQPGLQPAKAFNAYDAFRPGFATDNRLQLFTDLDGYTLRAGYANKFSAGILPANDYQRHTLDLSFNTQWYTIQPRLYISYSDTRERMPLRGANAASVLGGLYSTPPSFDLLNGNTTPRPWKNSATYQSADGSQRSFAPGQADHPYWLLHHMPDRQEQQKALYGLELLHRNYNAFEIQYNLALEKGRDQSVFGIPPAAAGATPARLSSRALNTTALSSNLLANYRLNTYNNSWSAEFFAGHNFTYLQEELNRRDGAEFGAGDAYALDGAMELQQLQISPYRRTHEVTSRGLLYWNGPYSSNWRLAQLLLTNRMYFSNTLAPDQSQFFLPAANLSVNLHQLELLKSGRFISELKVYSSYANTIREAPLLYNQWHFNSLRYSPENYRQYYELEELCSNPGLLPEKQQKWEAGLDSWILDSKLSISANYFLNITDQLLVPVFREGQYQLENSAKLQTPGLEVALKTRGYFDGGQWEIGATFSRSRPTIKELYHEQERLPVAGFSTISTNLVEGQPYGVLWGSRFSRNESGQVIIGEDGFPVVDPQGGIIGNPNPHWLGGLWGNADWNGFGFSFVLDIKKGGDVWNGTQQFLNYWGRSAYTAEHRGVEGYVFTGVNEAGAPNQQPVDFYNPANGLQDNRWVRYGAAGVAEEAVEVASWLRLNQLQLSCELRKQTAKALRLQRLKLSLIARNLFVLTNYSGVDPVSKLFGYQQGAGLDLFNQPNVKSYGFSLTLNL
ncbi:TonB-dependent outer membrane receptor [Flammeovirgaceae bacterium 311]|nr:TonB-dependent outer membrane receptor [Flammeovirgaceae bacterium 311]